VSRAVLTVKPGDSIRDAAVSMIERGVGSAVVMADGKPSGIITDRESLRAVAEDIDPNGATVSDYMVSRVTTATPSTELLDAARIMRDKGFRHLVVVDDSGELFGVFSMRDLVVGLLQDRASSAPA
jgi:CBS domain-containing protein